ncbi:MAG: 8-oxo-dGTP diphosphatase [Frankiales bacterium]|nr:8-oxo-dGTP diphosphatase [Frankiales bacterium]
MRRDEIAEAVGSFERLAVEDPTRKSAAVAVAIVTGDNGPGVLLTRRAAGMRAHAGQWALPGGRLDPGEAAVDAAVRELDEELGLTAPADAVLGLLDDYPTRSGYLITPVVLWLGVAGVLTPNPDEVASVHVVRLTDLDVEPEVVRIPESESPVIRLALFGGYVHAPTAAVLHQFREVALHRRPTRVAHYEQPVWAWQ